MQQKKSLKSRLFPADKTFFLKNAIFGLKFYFFSKFQDDQDDDKADGSFIEKLDQLVIEATKTCYDDYLDHVQVK